MADLIKPDTGYDWRCQRCGHQWRSRTPDAPAPAQCARCRSSYWNRVKTERKKDNGSKRGGVKAKVIVPPLNRDLAQPHHDLSVPSLPSPLLSPPPHLRIDQYYPAAPEPAPENAIRRAEPMTVPESAPEPVSDVEWGSNVD